MTSSQIREVQRRIGTTQDGFWGQKSIAACQRHLRSLMPSPNPWPSADQKSLAMFYGQPGDEAKLVNLPVAHLPIYYDGKRCKTIRCHRACSSSLLRVLEAIAVHTPHILGLYAGCYNNRPMRGGSLPSLHARGAAIDLAPDTNGNKTPWPVVADMPLEVMEAFAREGWTPAGSFWGRDAMHFQATKI